MRVSSPSGDAEGVVTETNGGATTSFGYEVHVVERGRAPGSVSRVAVLYGAGRNESAYGVNLRWESGSLLSVEYLNAKSATIESAMTRVAGRSITVTLKAGVRDPTAPPGGMLYNLELSRKR